MDCSHSWEKALRIAMTIIPRHALATKEAKMNAMFEVFAFDRTGALAPVEGVFPGFLGFKGDANFRLSKGVAEEFCREVNRQFPGVHARAVGRASTCGGA